MQALQNTSSSSFRVFAPYCRHILVVLPQCSRYHYRFTLVHQGWSGGWNFSATASSNSPPFHTRTNQKHQVRRLVQLHLRTSHRKVCSRSIGYRFCMNGAVGQYRSARTGHSLSAGENSPSSPSVSRRLRAILMRSKRQDQSKRARKQIWTSDLLRKLGDSIRGHRHFDLWSH